MGEGEFSGIKNKMGVLLLGGYGRSHLILRERVVLFLTFGVIISMVYGFASLYLYLLCLLLNREPLGQSKLHQSKTFSKSGKRNVDLWN